jgi:hypothetical protein
LSGDVLKELKLGGLRIILGSPEAKGAASFGGMDPFEGNPLTHGIQNSEIGGKKSRRLVDKGAIQFPAEVNAIPEALGRDDGTASGTYSSFPKVNGVLHLMKDCGEVGGGVGNLGEISVINEAVTGHTEHFAGEGGLQVKASALGTK